MKLDGEFVGTAPVNAKARPGPHEVIVSYPDYVTTSHHFEVPRGAEVPLRVDVTLERTAASAARAADVPLPPPTRATPAWDYALGGALAIVGRWPRDLPDHDARSRRRLQRWSECRGLRACPFRLAIGHC